MRLLQRQAFGLAINPISGRDGSIWPRHHIFVCRFHISRASITKIGDFVSLTIWIIPRKPFLKFLLQNCFNEKIFSAFPTPKGPPFEIFFFKINFFHFFSNKSYFFNLNLHFTCSELSFEVYNMSFGENFQIFIFYYRIPINNQVLSATSHS